MLWNNKTSSEMAAAIVESELRNVDRLVRSPHWQRFSDHRRYRIETASRLFECDLYLKFPGTKTPTNIEVAPQLRIFCPSLQRWWLEEHGFAHSRGLVFTTDRLEPGAFPPCNLAESGGSAALAHLIDERLSALCDRTEDVDGLIRHLVQTGGAWPVLPAPPQLPLDLILFLGGRDLGAMALSNFFYRNPTFLADADAFRRARASQLFPFSDRDDLHLTNLKLAARNRFPFPSGDRS